VETQDLDREIGFDGAGFGGIPEVEEDFDMLEPEEESHFSISRSIRTSTSIVFDHDQIVFDHDQVSLPSLTMLRHC